MSASKRRSKLDAVPPAGSNCPAGPGRRGTPFVAIGVLSVALTSCAGSSVPVQPIRGNATPSAAATSTPTPAATPTPTAKPTATPTPTAVPTLAPTAKPTPTPTPTPQPTSTPVETSSSSCFSPSGGGDAARNKRFATGYPYIVCENSTLFSATISQIGINYAIDFSNATEYGSLAAALYRSNPGSFRVPGTVVAAARGTLTNSPATLTVTPPGGSISIELGIFTEPGATGGLPDPAQPYTCSVFVDSTLVGTATTSTGSDSTYCLAEYNAPPAIGLAPYIATVTLPNALYVGHPYTLIISQ